MALVSAHLKKIGSFGLRYLSAGAAKAPSTPGSQPAPSSTSNTPKQAPVGVSKDGVYKVPEYYSFNTMSYYDLEKEMKPFRLPQPSSLKK